MRERAKYGAAAVADLTGTLPSSGRSKKRYGDSICIVGNIFMADLIEKEPADIEAQVRDRIECVGKGGGYIISSSNSLTEDMKPENIRAMIDAIDTYGWH